MPWVNAYSSRTEPCREMPRHAFLASSCLQQLAIEVDWPRDLKACSPNSTHSLTHKDTIIGSLRLCLGPTFSLEGLIEGNLRSHSRSHGKSIRIAAQVSNLQVPTRWPCASVSHRTPSQSNSSASKSRSAARQGPEPRKAIRGDLPA